MIGIELVADTNILIYFLEGNNNLRSFSNRNLALSIISEIEMMGWYRISAHETAVIKGMLSNCYVMELLPSIKEIAITLRQKNKIKLPDAVIAATAIYLGVPLLTADKNFAKLKDVDLLLVEI